MKCTHCSKKFTPNPKVKNQEYCGSRDCQKARRAKWQREKRARDPAYKDNQRRCWQEWLKRHPGYYKSYRSQNPEYTERNRLLQNRRDMQRRKNGPELLAKMDPLNKTRYPREGQLYGLVPQGGKVLAKMDSLIVKVISINRLGSHLTACKRELVNKKEQYMLK